MPDSDPASSTPPERAHSEQARRLLAAAVRHVLAHGFGDWSLRAMAAHLGTSHRMLIYYFDSADGFWERLLREIRALEVARRREVIGDELGVAGGIERAWSRFSSDSYLPVMQLLFELYARALRDREAHAAFLQDVVTSWLGPLERQLVRHLGLSSEEAALRARLQVATMRGLLLDVLATGEREQITAALRYFAQLMALPPRLSPRAD